MRLVLPLPEAWPRRDLGLDRTVVVVSGTFDAPDLALVLHHPRILQTSLLEWMDAVATSALQPTEKSVVMNATPVPHDLGWGTAVLHTVITRPDRAEPVEVRLTAFYALLRWHAAASIQGRRLDVYEERRGELVSILQRARPDWSDAAPVSLADLYA